MPTFPNPNDPRIDEFLTAVRGLSSSQWLMAVEIADGSGFQVASEEAWRLVSGALLTGRVDRKARFAAASVAHERIGLGQLPLEVKYNDADVSLRLRAEALVRHVINAYLAGNDIRLASFRAITAPFSGVLTFDDRTRRVLRPPAS